ncbi:unnamed protein product [Thelazia callipaeda]|uniref:Secreted protein n=1 Tax=Thelazia callipaeda TaxID=103827 RepID=A0A0N5D6U9_THECL|nr:unnamed protein product [Thelazia callipaeda]
MELRSVYIAVIGMDLWRLPAMTIIGDGDMVGQGVCCMHPDGWPSPSSNQNGSDDGDGVDDGDGDRLDLSCEMN